MNNIILTKSYEWACFADFSGFVGEGEGYLGDEKPSASMPYLFEKYLYYVIMITTKYVV